MKEQIDSILEQKGPYEITLLIRDDGSTDGTCQMLKTLAHRGDVQVEFGNNVGITESYQWLFFHSDTTCDYYALSDQDDVWLPNKLNEAMAQLEGQPKNLPLLFASLTHLVDKELRNLGSSVVPKHGVSYLNAMVQNVLPGHTQVFNRALLEMVCQRGFSDVHVIDWWFYLVASGMGKVFFFSNYTVLHRQHGGNAVGATTNPIKALLRRISYIKEGRGNAFALQLKSFYIRYGMDLPEEYQRETECFLNSTTSVWTRIRYCSHAKVYRQTVTETLLLKGLYILGKYNC